MHQHLGKNSTLLHHGTVGSQVAIQDGQAAGLGIGVLLVADDVLVHDLRLGDAVGPGAVHSLGGGVDESQAVQSLHDGAQAAGVVQVHQAVDAGGIQLHQMWHRVGNGVDALQVKLQPRLMGDGGQVQHGVGGAAQGHVRRQTVLDSLLRDDVTGAQVLFHQLHDLHACVLGKQDALALHGGDGAVAGQTQTQQLRHAVHGVGREHAGAGAAAGAGVLHDVLGLGLGHLAGAHGAGSLESVRQGHLVAIGLTGHHGATGAEDGGDVHPQGRHDHAGHDLVAVGDKHQTVKGMGVGHDLHGVRDVLTAGQREEHALVVHGNAVAHADGGELDRSATCHTDAGLHGLGDLVQMHVARDDLILSADHTDDGATQFLVCEAQGAEQRPVGNAVHAAFHQITTHACSPYYFLLKYRTLASSMYMRSRSRMASSALSPE